MSLSVIGSVRERDIPVPKEYNVFGVLWYSGRGVIGENDENIPPLGVDCWLYDLPGDFGDANGLIWMPRPGSTASSNLERLFVRLS